MGSIIRRQFNATLYGNHCEGADGGSMWGPPYDNYPLIEQQQYSLREGQTDIIIEVDKW